MAAGDAPDPGLQQKLAKLVAGLLAAAPTLPCPWDATLPAEPARRISPSLHCLLPPMLRGAWFP